MDVARESKPERAGLPVCRPIHRRGPNRSRSPSAGARVAVNKQMLATTIMAVPFIILAEAGRIALEIGRRRTFLLALRDTVNVRRLATYPALRKWEQQVLDQVRPNHRNDVFVLTWRLVGMDSPDPWTRIINAGRAELVGMGYLVETRSGAAREYLPVPARIAELVHYANEWEGLVDKFRRENSGLYLVLMHEVEKGIRMRMTLMSY